LKNGLLPVTLEAELVSLLITQALTSDNYELTTDLDRRTVTDGKDLSTSFFIDDFQRDCLMEGLDDIGLTLIHEPDIAAYELKRSALMRQTSSGSARKCFAGCVSILFDGRL
jgi:3-isopropylmalate/(R)-2-methylmalate dehydratase small subunit